MSCEDKGCVGQQAVAISVSLMEISLERRPQGSYFMLLCPASAFSTHPTSVAPSVGTSWARLMNPEVLASL